MKKLIHQRKAGRALAGAILMTLALTVGCDKAVVSSDEVSGGSSILNQMNLNENVSDSATSNATTATDVSSTLLESTTSIMPVSSAVSKQTASSKITSSKVASSIAASSIAASSMEMSSQTVSLVTSSGSGNPLVDMGLGQTETSHVSLNRDYEWYVDQFATGEYGAFNGGPSCVWMVGKWVNKDFSIPVEDIRTMLNVARNDTGITGISPSYLTYALNFYAIPTDTKQSYSIQTAIDTIYSGKLLIVNVNMSKLTFEPNVYYHVNKYVTNVYSQYLIIKGYRVVDGNIWLECYDTNSHGQLYADGQLKGKDRYYLADELVGAVYNTFVIG